MTNGDNFPSRGGQADYEGSQSDFSFGNDFSFGEQDSINDWDVSENISQSKITLDSQTASFVSDEDNSWGSIVADFEDDLTIASSVEEQKKKADFWEEEAKKEEVRSATVPEKKQVNFGYKGAALVIGALFLGIAIFLYLLNSIKIDKKEPVAQTNVSVQQTQQVTKSASGVKDSLTLTALDDSVNIDYSGTIYDSTGIIQTKSKYLQGNQVIYCLDIAIAVGEESTIMKYYCSYAAWTSVAQGDIVDVKYQQVSGKCFSINEVVK